MITVDLAYILNQTVDAVYQIDHIGFGAFTAAGIASFFRTNGTVTDVKTLLAQISLVLCVVFALFMVFVKLQQRTLKAAVKEAAPEGGAVASVPAPAGLLRDRWVGIVQFLESPREAEWRHAIIEADKLIDDALAKAGFPGDTFGDRLSNIQPGTLLALDGVWWAHKVRNRLAHEVDYFLRYTEARQAIGYYEAALAELKLI